MTGGLRVELNPTWSVVQDLYRNRSLDLSGLYAGTAASTIVGYTQEPQPRPQWAIRRNRSLDRSGLYAGTAASTVVGYTQGPQPRPQWAIRRDRSLDRSGLTGEKEPLAAADNVPFMFSTTAFSRY
jgi:hypothetical protein